MVFVPTTVPFQEMVTTEVPAVLAVGCLTYSQISPSEATEVNDEVAPLTVEPVEAVAE